MINKNISFKYLKSNFIKCGFIGWAVEIFFTCFHNMAVSENRKLMGQTSLFMFPIYGLGTFIPLLSYYFKKLGLFMRGSIYAVIIFIMEYISGSFLNIFNLCPWDYSKNPYNINGLIRLDFFPFWFILGLIFEQTRPRKKS